LPSTGAVVEIDSGMGNADPQIREGSPPLPQAPPSRYKNHRSTDQGEVVVLSAAAKAAVADILRSLPPPVSS
jgi:hypothetical protein